MSTSTSTYRDTLWIALGAVLGVDAADAALWAEVKAWAGLRHVMTSGKVAAALNTWAKGKGLE